MKRRQPNALNILALGIIINAIAVILPLAQRPRYVMVGVGLGLIVFALFRMIQQRRR